LQGIRHCLGLLREKKGKKEGKRKGGGEETRCPLWFAICWCKKKGIKKEKKAIPQTLNVSFHEKKGGKGVINNTLD